MALGASVLLHGMILAHSSGNLASSFGQPSALTIQAKLASRTTIDHTQDHEPDQEAAVPLQDATQETEPPFVTNTSSPSRPRQGLTPDNANLPEEKSGSIQNADSFAPELEQAFMPRYPFMALSKGIRGTVSARFRVGKDGSIEDVVIISSPVTGGFDAAVIQALANTRIDTRSVHPNSMMMVTVIFDPAGINHQSSFALTSE